MRWAPDEEDGNGGSESGGGRRGLMISCNVHRNSYSHWEVLSVILRYGVSFLQSPTVCFLHNLEHLPFAPAGHPAISMQTCDFVIYSTLL